MKKLTLLSVVLLGFATAAFADVFTPLDFGSTSAPKGTSAIVNMVTSSNTNLQNAILELDTAQVEVRNNLLNYTTRYSEIDAQYNQVKEQRRELKKQVRNHERRIRDIDRAKDKIRKNMEQM